ncbi:MAG: LacI family transcriptional regulator [Promicromonosporaceae bacterium]|nr:LacI family transcriptional regulator [Promicromonosporaceae bacterium]
MVTKDGAATGKRPTIREVAAQAGVSRGTVSRYLNGGHNVSAESRHAIAQAIKVSGYSVNLNARALATGRSGAIAFLISEPHQLLFEDPIFAILLREATAAAADLDLQMVLMMASSEAEQRRVLEFVTTARLDWVLLVSSHESDPLLGSLLEHNVPTVTSGVPLGYEGRVSGASADDRSGGRMATEYLLSQGHRRIATITGPSYSPGGVYRLEGYRDALGARYDEALVHRGDYTQESGFQAMITMLGEGAAPDALFAHNDLMAIGAIQALQEQGVSVPGQLAVIGFDDSGPGAQMSPTLTTMRQPFEQLAQEMVRLLVAAIEGGPPTHVTLPAVLTRRESA